MTARDSLTADVGRLLLSAMLALFTQALIYVILLAANLQLHTTTLFAISVAGFTPLGIVGVYAVLMVLFQSTLTRPAASVLLGCVIAAIATVLVTVWWYYRPTIERSETRAGIAMPFLGILFVTVVISGTFLLLQRE